MKKNAILALPLQSERTDWIALQDEKGLLFRPLSQLAVLAWDDHGRWRVTLQDGAVAHLPGDRPQGPWVPLDPKTWVLPHHLQRLADEWVDPAGFRYPYQPLEPVCWTDPPAGAVLTLCSHGSGSLLRTDEGEFLSPLTAVQRAKEFPGLLLATRGNYYNPARLRRIERDQTRHRLVLDNGSSLLVSHKFHFKAAQRLGLPHFFHLEPHQPGVWRDDKREYPYDLINAKADRLKADFRSARHLIANLLWQILRRRQRGIPDHPYPDYREVWYYAVKTTLYRAGYLSRAELAMRATSSPSFLLLQTVMAQMVGEDRLCTFREFGFEDKGTEDYRIGHLRPNVLIVCEKDSLSPKLHYLNERFGVSTIVLGGQPSLIGSEFFAEKIAHLGPIHVIAYVDYDPAGWIIARSFVEQLKRYGIECPGGVRAFLVLPQYFSAEELELFALPIESESAASAAKAQLWLQETGGSNGQPWSITANRLDPAERVAAVLEAYLANVQDQLLVRTRALSGRPKTRSNPSVNTKL